MIDKSELEKFIQKRNLEEYQEDINKELEIVLKKVLDDKIKEIKNKQRIISNDSIKDRISAKKVFSKSEIKTMPTWIQDDIDNAHVIGKSKKVIQVSNGKKYHLNNRLNDLSGGEWTFFLRSVICTRYSTSGKDSYAHHIRKLHPSPKPPQLMRDIINFLTKKNEIVLDYFMGVGGSLLGASMCGRKGIGIDLEEKYIDAYKKASEYLGLDEQKTILGDSLEILKSNKKLLELKDNKISLVLIDPPYGDMMSKKKTGETIKKKKNSDPTPFTNNKLDLGNMTYDDFLVKFAESVHCVLDVLKKGGHIVVFTKDMQPNQTELNLLHSDIIYKLSKIKGLRYIGMKIWADDGVNLYPYGYPYSMVINQIHQYIMFFKKE